MNIDEILSRFDRVKKDGGQFAALCPVHQDKTASLRIKEEGGKILVKCHAGCTVTEIVSAVGLKMSDLFLEPLVKTKGSRLATSAETVYRYTDAKGEYLFEKARKPGKEFVQRINTGSGLVFQLAELGDAAKTLYRLPELISALDSNETVYICEGEKACDKMYEVGLAATCQPGGASRTDGKWLPMHTKILEGADVVIIADRDETGEMYAAAVAKALAGVVRDLQVVQSKSTKVHDDAYDHIVAGYHLDDWVDRPDLMPVKFKFRLTDVGNCDRIIARFGQDLKYCAVWRKWLIWDGKRYQIDETDGAPIYDMARKVARELYKDALKEENDSARKQISKFAIDSQKSRNLDAAIKLVRLSPIVAISPKQIDSNPRLLNVSNGTLDLSSGSINPHRHGDMITKLIDFEYRADAINQCPRWKKFIVEIMGGDEAKAKFIWRALGYSLYGDRVERVFFFCHGFGANGKTTLLERVGRILGDYASTADIESFTNKNSEGIPNDLARLQGARLVTTSETEEGRRLAESKLKKLTGGDTIVARFLRAEFFEFKPQFALWILGNHEPVIKGTDHGIWDRIIKIPFDQRFEGEARDGNLALTLDGEAEGILAWLVAGCKKWQDEGLNPPESVVAAKEEYRASQDVIGQFLSECTMANTGNISQASKLHAAYSKWSRQAEMKPMSANLFSRNIKSRGVPKRETSSGTFYEIEIKPEWDEIDQHPRQYKDT